MSDPEELEVVEVATFLYSHEAEVARAVLEAHGIDSFIQDGEMARANWMLVGALGGVKLQVAAGDAERARALLEEDHTGESQEWEADGADDGAESEAGETAEPETATEVTCPFCGSRELSFARFSKAASVWALLLLGIPLLVRKRRYTCDRCHRTWREGEGGTGNTP